MKQLQKRIKKIAEEWIDFAGFRWWQIDLVYIYDRHETVRDVQADCKTMWAYRRARIQFFLAALMESDYSDEELEDIIVHELSHILVASLVYDDTDIDKMECAVENVARALLFTKRRVKK